MTRIGIARSKLQRRGTRKAAELRIRVAAEVRQAREDSGLTQRALARHAGVSNATVNGLESGAHDPTTEVLARIATVLGMDLGVRLYPGTGPLVRDHIQAAMIEALISLLHERWRPTPEVPVRRPIRGVIDLVLEDDALRVVACEAYSELRRLEQQIRWSKAKADALGELRGTSVARLLLLRSTVRTRAVVSEYASVVAAAYPAPTEACVAALGQGGPWPGDTLLWCRVEGGLATVLDRPPRGIRVGR
jgi:transcriptional regulator with XRE-family HTH domain